jgi:hypothetical protein
MDTDRRFRSMINMKLSLKRNTENLRIYRIPAHLVDIVPKSYASGDLEGFQGRMAVVQNTADDVNILLNPSYFSEGDWFSVFRNTAKNVFFKAEAGSGAVLLTTLVQPFIAGQYEAVSVVYLGNNEFTIVGV